ncbi:MAG: GtrA family protein [Polynucleobacter sp.]|jgi:putative flippase GtrA|nr:GtrA family protein [Polynucleobacter sp.]
MIRPSWISLRIGQFILVGGTAASIHLGVVVCLVELYSISPLQANLLGFFVSFCFSFLGQRFLTFRDSNKSLRASIPRYFIVASSAFALNETLFAITLHYLMIPYYFALGVVVLLVAVATYFASKYWAFANV